MGLTGQNVNKLVLFRRCFCSEEASTSSAYKDVIFPSSSPRLAALSSDKEGQLRGLYEKLDRNDDGIVDVKELSEALKLLSPHSSKYAQQFFNKVDVSQDDEIDFKEFVCYILEHEKHLEFVFNDMDRNDDGFIDYHEIKNYLHDLGIAIGDKEAKQFVATMAKRGDSRLALEQFTDYLRFYPSRDIKDTMMFWRHSMVIDIGEDGLVPEDFSGEEIQSGVWWRHLVAGGLAGAVSRTGTAPLDRLKVFLQVHSRGNNKLRLVSGIRYLLKEGGVKSLWRGNGVNVVKIAPESALKFMAYEQVKRLLKAGHIGGNEELSMIERFIAGSTAGSISQTVIYPLEVLKTRLALRKTGQLNKGVMEAIRSLYKSEGSRCFYRGYLPNLIGIIPYAGIDLAVYETLKNLYIKKFNGQREPGVLALLGCGTASTVCGQLASYPLALVRTRLQAKALSSQMDQPSTMSGQFRSILEQEGLTGLYRGITPNFMKVIPAVGISYVVYESARRQLGATMT